MDFLETICQVHAATFVSTPTPLADSSNFLGPEPLRFAMLGVNDLGLIHSVLSAFNSLVVWYGVPSSSIKIEKTLNFQTIGRFMLSLRPLHFYCWFSRRNQVTVLNLSIFPMVSLIRETGGELRPGILPTPMSSIQEK